MKDGSKLSVMLKDSDPPVVLLKGEADRQHSKSVETFLADIRATGTSAAKLDLTEISTDAHSFLAFIEQVTGAFDVLEIRATQDVAKLVEIHGLGDLLCKDKPAESAEDSGTTRNMISFLLPARAESSQMAREQIDSMTIALPFSESERMDIRVAVGEAVANAIRHGCRETPWKHVRVRCITDGESLTIDIADDGPGFELSEVAPLDIASLPESGMGIHCMRRTMDEVIYDFSEGTTVRLVKHVRAPAPCC